MIQTNIFSKGRPLAEYLKKQRENKKFIKTVETGGTFALITFFLLFAIRPTALTISALIGEIKAKEQMVAEMRKKIGNLVLAQDAFSQVQEKYKVISSALPDNADYRQSMVQITSAAKESGILIDKLNYDLTSVKKDTGPSQLESFSVAINKAASFQSALDLTDKLLHNRRLIGLESIRISSTKNEKKSSESESTPSDNQINISFVNEIYFWQNQNEKK